LLAEAVKAARRSLDIATIQYREGLAGFERVLDSQRALFSQQERLVSTTRQRRAEPDRAVQGDGRRLAAGAQPAPGRRRDARDDGRAQRLAEMLSAPLPPARCRRPPQITPEREAR
jgi:multidrug efflux system outer membrane protein